MNTNVRSGGFTLTEVMVVIVLAGVVTLGLVSFYLNSQATWLDASSQALAQRDATSIIELIGRVSREADEVAIQPCPPRADTMLVFRRAGVTTNTFWWSPTDSLLHQGTAGCDPDLGPVVPSKIERFSLGIDPALPVVHLTILRVRSTTGERVEMRSSFALYNAP